MFTYFFTDLSFYVHKSGEHETHKIIYKDSVCTSQETHYVSATKKALLMLFRETVSVYCGNHTERMSTLCVCKIIIKSAIKSGGACGNHSAASND
jgi:hypothetical protein